MDVPPGIGPLAKRTEQSTSPLRALVVLVLRFLCGSQFSAPPASPWASFAPHSASGNMRRATATRPLPKFSASCGSSTQRCLNSHNCRAPPYSRTRTFTKNSVCALAGAVCTSTVRLVRRAVQQQRYVATGTCSANLLWQKLILLNLEDQLQQLWERRDLAPFLQLPAAAGDGTGMRSLYDSPAWRSFLLLDGFGTNPFNLALCLCADGWNPFHRSQVSIWPIMFAVRSVAMASH